MIRANVRVVLLLVAVSACGSSSDGSGPVSGEPLRGDLSGREFVAVSARARSTSRDPGRKSIEIFDSPSTCKSGLVAGPPRYITLSLPWTAGYAADFSLTKDGQLGSFVVSREGRTTLAISATGRVELIDTPATGGKARLRLRMSEKDGSVEGEVLVDVCD